MKQNESSMTSLVSAFGRAYHSRYDSPKIFDDFIADRLMTEKEFRAVSMNMTKGIHFFNPEIAQRYQDNPDEILKWITQVQLSPTPLARSAYCESVLQNELTLGVKQYAILGAGLDTFAFRYPELEHKLEIYEVDHPQTQTFKKKKIAEANLSIPTNLHFVPMDFTKRFSNQDLVDNGFSYQKTFFSLLGVSYYLMKEENEALIKQLFVNVPVGSSIVFDYADETLFSEKGKYNRVANMVNLAAASGEPMKACFTYEEIERMLEEAGLLIYEHLTPTRINELFFANRTDYLTAFETINYIHAVKKD
ncbi:class I SAM-dependent methyltransferase [Ornithinibacillus halotolerans]|uniref:S-adenosyl-L-methionine-dependent methyltransferase n=1 Tax=Ornithinibacillus halotolerans TaxID=1274357 RepID=A0A916S246_9BACI|nr:class I SAM-dependent methyltransferase [Ornithinibacillus halotolerans]GGA80444.1 putative S-adenosyl-L-methionine-dependent methyltransferase YktD [Ornithinibacillus halotolerans]